MESVRCNICSGEAKFLFKSFVLNKYEVDYYKCPICEFIQTESPYWLDEAYKNAITDLDIGLVSRNVIYSNAVEIIILKYFKSGEKFLDYAGGYGLFVRLMRDKGFNFYREDKYCENIFTKNYDLVDLIGDNKFEIVTAFEVFEHLVNPLEEIKNIFKYSDSLIFSTELQPHLEIKDIKDWWYFVPETGQHISFYSLNTLKYIALKFNSYFYSNGSNLHLFTNKKFVNNPLLNEQFSDDNKKIEITNLIQSDYDFAKNVIRRTDEINKEIHGDINDLSKLNDKMENQSEILVRKLSLSYAELDRIKSQYERIKSKLETTNSELDSAKSELATAKSQFETTNSELDSIKSELATAKSQLETVNSEHDSTKSELAKAKSQFETTNSELDSTKSELATAKSQLETVNSEHDSTKSELATTKSQFEATNSELDSTKSELTKAKSQFETTNSELDSIKSELATAKSQLETVNSEHDSTKSELAKAKSQFEATNSELNSTRYRLETVISELGVISNSYGWRLILFLYKLVNLFFPTGSLRRRIAVIIWNFGLLLMQIILKVYRKLSIGFRHFIKFLARLGKPKKGRRINTRSKKIVYIGHSYHNKTKSTLFLLDYLRQFYDVEVILDESWNGGSYPDLSFIDNSYLGVIFFQNLPTVNQFEKIKNDNLIFFPMYDSSGGLTQSWWNRYCKLKIVNFSKTLHTKLLEWGFESMYIQYFPKPGEFTPGNANEVFFWQRTNNININTIIKLFDQDEVKIHIHKAIDPNYQFCMPSIEDEKKYNIRYSDWFETREDLWNVIKQKGIYIAPREHEGIGMSFLEAMALGKVIIAVDNPTMNEYIIHGLTGYLFNLAQPQNIDLSALLEVQENTYKYISEGYDNWEKQKHTIIEFILKS
ncbi:MAG: glycosyltransferase [Bacteroidales bacterium]|nr:glycosyltransferase [Bacteroidales bacterium]